MPRKLLSLAALDKLLTKNNLELDFCHYLVNENGNHNKYYILLAKKNSTRLQCFYGRIGYPPRTASYPISDKEKKLSEKLRKGYWEINEAEAHSVYYQLPFGKDEDFSNYL